MMMLRMGRYCAGCATRSHMRLYAVVVAVGLVGVAGCSSENTSAPGTPAPSVAPSAAAPSVPLAAAYHSPEGYSIIPPEGWVQRSTSAQDGVSVFFGAPEVDRAAPKPFTDNVNVVITASGENVDRVVSDAKEQYPSVLTNYKVVIDEPAVANGHPARLLGGTYDAEGFGSMQNIQLLVVNAGKAYSATFTFPAASFSSYEAAARASLASFTLG